MTRSGQSLHFILDTTELREQRRLESSHFRALIHARKVLDDAVSIPEIVLLEHARHVRSEIARRFDSMKGEAHELGRWLGRDVRVPDVKVAEEAAACEAWMRSHIEKLGVTILPVPDVSHASVIRRDLDRRKPFDEESKGYRDSLIWEAVLAVAQRSSARVVFVSRNHKDFAQKNGQLHQDLVDDLVSQGSPADRVSYANGLKDAVERHVFPRLPSPTDAAKIKLEAAAHQGGWLRRWVERELSPLVGPVIVAELPPKVETGRISRVKSVENLRVTDARPLEHEVFAEIEATLIVDVVSESGSDLARVDSKQSTTMALLQVAAYFMQAALLRDVKLKVRFAATISKGAVVTAEVWEARLDPRPAFNIANWSGVSSG